MKYTPVKGKVYFSEAAHEMLAHLISTGLFGEDESDCVSRIVEQYLWEHSDKPTLKLKKK